ncbi:MAG: type II secretion system protein [Planctomycetota bacterium]
MPCIHPTRRRIRPARRGFTLVEILIVVVILGILAAIVIPTFSNAAQDTRKTTFARDLNTYTQAIMRYQVDTDEYPPDGSSGSMPAELVGYADGGRWGEGTPIGGAWDNETDDSSITAGVGVHFDGSGQTRDATYMTEIDLLVDDGDLENGSFRRLAAGRYYRVIAE